MPSVPAQTSVTAGTVLDRTRLPLPLWFAAAYLVTTHTRASRRCSCSASSGSPATSSPGFANLKTWLLGTHHGVGAKHLPHYVDEFVFRLYGASGVKL